MLFLLQTDAAAATWPITDETVADVAAAFAACTPTAEELAAVDPRERVHRNGAPARPRARRKMKRAGQKTRQWRESHQER